MGTSRMRRRLRKKLRVGEFREYGFELSYELRPDVTEGEADAFLDAFIEQVEADGLLCGGGGEGGSWSFLVTPDGRGTTHDKDRASLESWLESEAEVVNYRIGGFLDLWHGPDLA